MKRVFSICVCSITEATSNLSLAEKWAGLQNISEGLGCKNDASAVKLGLFDEGRGPFHGAFQAVQMAVLATWYICSRRMRKKDELTAHSCRTYQLCDPKCFLPSCHPLNQLTFFEILLPFSKGDTMVGSRSFHESGTPDTFLVLATWSIRSKNKPFETESNHHPLLANTAGSV
jgi:hypothetical protein